jgi:hypothetical protein
MNVVMGHGRVLAAVAVVILLSGCAATRGRTGAPEESGFLGNYSGLAKDPAYPAALVYMKPGVQWTRYSTIQLDSAGLYLADSSSKVSPDDQEHLAGMLYNTLRDELDKYFVLASGPGAETIRVRAALTQVQGAKVTARVVTTAIPQLRMLSAVGGLATDTAATVGTATGEMEVLDSVTGERLAAAVDERAGTKALFAGRAYTQWGDVQAAVNYWAKRMAWQLARQGVRRKSGVAMPTEPEPERSL